MSCEFDDKVELPEPVTNLNFSTQHYVILYLLDPYYNWELKQLGNSEQL